MSKTNKDQSPFHGIFEGCTKEQKTQLGVAHAVLHYTKLGFIVCFPPPDTQGVGWDLLACKPNGTPIKIQVKTTGQQVGKNGYYAVGLKDGHYAEMRDMDVLRDRLDILNTMEPYIGEWFSKEYVQKHVFRMTDEEIKRMDKQINKEPPPPDDDDDNDRDDSPDRRDDFPDREEEENQLDSQR